MVAKLKAIIILNSILYIVVGLSPLYFIAKIPDSETDYKYWVLGSTALVWVALLIMLRNQYKFYKTVTKDK